MKFILLGKTLINVEDIKRAHPFEDTTDPKKSKSKEDPITVYAIYIRFKDEDYCNILYDKAEERDAAYRFLLESVGIQLSEAN